MDITTNAFDATGNDQLSPCFLRMRSLHHTAGLSDGGVGVGLMMYELQRRGGRGILQYKTILMTKSSFNTLIEEDITHCT